jgi:hypothetical protein
MDRTLEFQLVFEADACLVYVPACGGSDGEARDEEIISRFDYADPMFFERIAEFLEKNDWGPLPTRIYTWVGR